MFPFFPHCRVNYTKNRKMSFLEHEFYKTRYQKSPCNNRTLFLVDKLFTDRKRSRCEYMVDDHSHHKQIVPKRCLNVEKKKLKNNLNTNERCLKFIIIIVSRSSREQEIRVLLSSCTRFFFKIF